MPDGFAFRLTATDGAARSGEIATPHGVVRTPAFMPVGTQAAIKGVHHDDVRAAGADILLANTYHPMLRPSAERVTALADGVMLSAYRVIHSAGRTKFIIF